MTLYDGIRTRLDTVWGSESYAALGLLANGESLESMRNRSRRLEENNVLACAIADRAEENVIGSGIVLRAATSDQEFNNQANDTWKRLTDGTRMDVRNMHSWGKMQRLAFRSKKIDGDVAIVLIDQGFGPQLQIVEGHNIETPSGVLNPRIIHGVEYDNSGRPIAYWMRQTDDWGMVTHRRVLARDVIFLHDHFRYSASRGIPAFHGSYTLFDQILGYLDAVVVASRIGASQAIIAKRKDVKGSLRKLAGRDTDSAGDTRRTIPIQPGTVNIIDVVEDLVAFNPSQPQAQFTDAMRTFCRFIGLKWGLTIERVLLDFSKANYSVSRSTAIQECQTAAIEQDDFYNRALSRVWRWSISKSIKSGFIKRAPPEDYLRHEWMPQGRQLVEPSKDAPGLEKLIALGVESRQNVCAERGYDWKQIAKENAEAIQEYNRLGIALSTQPEPDPIPPKEDDDDEDEPEGEGDAAKAA